MSASVVTKPRIAFAGLGSIGRHCMTALIESGLAEVALVCDADGDLSDQTHATTRSFNDVLDSGADAVVIATPPALHAEQCVAALERGMAVFCRKPLGRNGDETQLVVDVARANDLLLGVDFSYRYTAALRAVHDLVRGGGIGEVFAIDATFHNAHGPDQPWLYDPILSGGGCVNDLGIHLVDMALRTLGFPRVQNVTARLFARGNARFDPKTIVEDYATARVDVEGGRTIQLACSWNLDAGRDCLVDVAFYGTRGAAALRNVDGSCHDFVAERYEGTKTTTLAAPPDAWGSRAIVAWAEKLAKSRSFDDELEHLVDVARVLDRIYETGRTR